MGKKKKNQEEVPTPREAKETTELPEKKPTEIRETYPCNMVYRD